MDNYERKQIERDNRAEVQRARTGLSSRDWGIVLGALIIAVALLGFIYASDNTGVDPAGVEPASGTTSIQTDNPGLTGDAMDTTPEDAPELNTSPADTPLDQSPNPAD